MPGIFRRPPKPAARRPSPPREPWLDYIAEVRKDAPSFVFPMDEASGSITDLINGLTGTASGSPTYGQTGPVNGHTGIDFPTTSDYFTVADNDALDIDLSVHGFTLEAWVRRDVASGSWEVWGWKGQNGWEWGVSADVVGALFTGQGNVGATAYTTTYRVPADGLWHYYAVSIAQNAGTLVTGDLAFYADGVKVAHTMSTSKPLSTALPVVIGAETTAGASGAIAYHTLYKSVLSGDRIRAHYNARNVTPIADYETEALAASPVFLAMLDEPSGNLATTAVPAAYVQSIGSAYDESSATSIVLSVSKTVTVGNTIVASVSLYGNRDSTIACVDNLGNVYTKVASVYAAGSQQGLYTFVAPITNGGALTSITASWTTTLDPYPWRTLIADEFSGLGTPSDGGENTGTGTTMTWHSSGTIAANGAVVGASFVNSIRTHTAGSASGTPSTAITLAGSFIYGDDPSTSHAYAIAGASDVTSFVGTTNNGLSATWIATSVKFLPRQPALVGTATGSPTYGLAGPIVGHTAIEYPTHGDYHSFPDDAVLDLVGSDVTVIAWYYRNSDAYADWQGLLCKDSAWGISLDPGDNHSWTVPRISQLHIGGGSTGWSGSWKQFVFQKRGRAPKHVSEIITWVNAVQQSTTYANTGMDVADNANALIVGNDITEGAGAGGVLGRLAAVAIYKSWLSPEQIARLYAARDVAVAGGDQTIALGLIDAGPAIYAPTVIQPSQTVTIGLIDAGSAIYSLTAATKNTLTIGLIDAGSAIYSLTLTPKNTLAVGLIDSGPAIYALTAIQDQFVTLGLIDSGSEIYSLTAIQDQFVSLGLVDAASAIYQPTLGTRYVISPALIDSGSAIYALTVQPDQFISLGLIDGGAAIYSVVATHVRTLTIPPIYSLSTMFGGFNLPRGIAITPDGAYAYISDYGSFSVIVWRLSDDSLYTTIGISSLGQGNLKATPNGTYVYVPNAGGLAKRITVSSNTVTATISGVSNGYRIAINAAGTRAYVTGYGPTGSIYVLDLTNDTLLTTITSGVPTYPQEVAVTPDDAYVYVTSQVGVTKIRTSDNTVVGSIAGMPTYCYGIAITSDGTKAIVSRAAVVYICDLATDTISYTVPLTGTDAATYYLTLSADDARAYVGTFSTGIAVVDIASHSQLPGFGVGGAFDIAVTPDDTRIYATHLGMPLGSYSSIKKIFPYFNGTYPLALVYTQPLTLGLIDSGSAIYAPTATQPFQPIVVGLIDGASAIHAPTLTTKNTLVIGLIDSGPAIYSLTVIQDQFVSLGLVDAGSAIYALTLAPKSTLTLGLIDAGSAIYALSAIQDQFVSLGLIDATSAIYSVVLAPKNTLIVGLIDGTPAIYSPTLVAKSTLIVGLIDGAPAIYSLTLVKAAYPISLGLIDAGSAVYVPTVAGGAVGIFTVLIDSGAVVYALVVHPDQFLTLPLTDAGNALYAPTLTVGPVGATLPLIDAGGAVYDLVVDVLAGFQTVALGLVEEASAIYDLALSTLNGLVLGLIDSGSAVYIPGVVVLEPVTGTGASHFHFSVAGTALTETLGTGDSTFGWSVTGSGSSQPPSGSTFGWSTSAVGTVVTPVTGVGASAFGIFLFGTGSIGVNGTGGSSFGWGTAGDGKAGASGTGGSTFGWSTAGAGDSAQDVTGTGASEFDWDMSGGIGWSISDGSIVGVGASSFGWGTSVITTVAGSGFVAETTGDKTWVTIT